MPGSQLCGKLVSKWDRAFPPSLHLPRGAITSYLGKFLHNYGNCSRGAKYLYCNFSNEFHKWGGGVKAENVHNHEDSYLNEEAKLCYFLSDPNARNWCRSKKIKTTHLGDSISIDSEDGVF